ncbi:hypothetical protein CNEO4_580100 [Clostridium neonatale]|nr:hypothetical protein CNEO_490037 [Clostridium neonatale]CAI3696938.1 hypothetical protein CNEO4_580100 [Clostridium neonatale]CAI3697881.1 hypothetical protein CNEO4_570096 [Clostridium neonatale]
MMTQKIKTYKISKVWQGFEKNGLKYIKLKKILKCNCFYCIIYINASSLSVLSYRKSIYKL